MGKSEKLPMLSPGATLSQRLHLFINLQTLQASSFWTFIEALSHSHDSLNHWPLLTEFHFQPLSLRGGSAADQCQDQRKQEKTFHPYSLLSTVFFCIMYQPHSLVKSEKR